MTFAAPKNVGLKLFTAAKKMSDAKTVGAANLSRGLSIRELLVPTPTNEEKKVARDLRSRMGISRFRYGFLELMGIDFNFIAGCWKTGNPKLCQR